MKNYAIDYVKQAKDWSGVMYFENIGFPNRYWFDPSDTNAILFFWRKSWTYLSWIKVEMWRFEK